MFVYEGFFEEIHSRRSHGTRPVKLSERVCKETNGKVIVTFQNTYRKTQSRTLLEVI